MLKDSEANMNCNEEPLETNTANEFKNITIKKEIVDPEETFADIKPIETLTTMPQPNYNWWGKKKLVIGSLFLLSYHFFSKYQIIKLIEGDGGGSQLVSFL